MRLSAKARQDRSKLRQALNKELAVWDQRVKDMEIALLLKAPGAAEKMLFVRQEKAKLQRKLKDLDRGFGRQRAWSQGKLLY
jgi:hypothetical protein